MLLSAKLQKVLLCRRDLRPSGSMNKLGGPKQVTLAASREGWVEKSHMGVCPLSAFYPGSIVI